MSDKREKEKKEGHKGIMKGKESRQARLKLEEVDREKRVKFSQEGQEEKFRQELTEFKAEVRKELVDVKVELLKKEWEEKLRILEERIIKIEEYIEYQKEEERNKNEMENRWREREKSAEDSESRSNVSEDKSSRSYRSYKSYNTIDSVGLSDRELDKVRRMVLDKEKEERRDNIAIKGVITEEKDLKKWVSEFIKEKLKIDVEIISCRKSGEVLIAKLKDGQMKRKVMENKSKLKGGRIFIENDLTWQERKTQEKINKWAKEEKGKGKEVKIGYARVKIGGIWRKWEDVEREEEENRRKGEEEGRGEDIVEDRRDFI